MPLEQQPHKTGAHRDLSAFYLADEADVLAQLVETVGLTRDDRDRIEARATNLAQAARDASKNGQLIDRLLQEYGLSSDEGVTLMRLCEALVRTPDSPTARQLIRDKLGAGKWDQHVAQADSVLVNTATYGLLLSSKWILATGGVRATSLAARLGDETLLRVVRSAMELMGQHFVLGATIPQALGRAHAGEDKGFSYSYDMLGEAAYTNEDADRYFQAYLTAAQTIQAQENVYSSIGRAPSISVKLSALHPRYEYNQRHMCIPELVEKVRQLALIARSAGVGLTIDAEEADRLETSLELFERLLHDDALDDWDGLGLVVQAYQRRALNVVERLHTLVRTSSQSINVRLVKGAYWDSEIKRAQLLGLKSYPVFTRKENTDVSYLACARRLLEADDRIFPQFATHNAHTAAAIIEMAGPQRAFEFQRLHGMGEPLHQILMQETDAQCRVYAPVGQHKDLLPYLVRRLLENGANSSFVNQLHDPALEISDIIRDPLTQVEENQAASHPKIPSPCDQFGGSRMAAAGTDVTCPRTAARLGALTDTATRLTARSLIAGMTPGGASTPLRGPTALTKIGDVEVTTPEHVRHAIMSARAARWTAESRPAERAAIISRAADLMENDQDFFFDICVREAGKTLPDAIAEVREAIDFCRYYAEQCLASTMDGRRPLGTVACISPWNFPLAIFMGQVVAALAAGNTVVAKPAGQTPAVAFAAVRLLHRAGIPEDALHLVIGGGSTVGAALVESAGIDGICFTGSTQTAKGIAATLSKTNRPQVPLIAETGGINAMIVDSTALLEHAVADIVSSAFQSAGQRCSACRLVCVQDDIADEFIRMLSGATALLNVGDPARLDTDVGPVIDGASLRSLSAYVEKRRRDWPVLAQASLNDTVPPGHFIAPVALEVPSIASVQEEVFGPVLHVYRFKAEAFEDTIHQVNALGYGLTMGLHTRIDDRVQNLTDLAQVGNVYVNRNQIGAVVGVQPFGGEGLSGTGPKAGGPHYLRRLSRSAARVGSPVVDNADTRLGSVSTTPDLSLLQRARSAFRSIGRARTSAILADAAKTVFSFDPDLSVYLHSLADMARSKFEETLTLPGPTGETNTLSLAGRGVVVCATETASNALPRLILLALASGNAVIALTDELQTSVIDSLQNALQLAGMPRDRLQLDKRANLRGWLDADIDAVAYEGPDSFAIAKHLCLRDGAIIPLLSESDDAERFCVERTLTIDTTAAGGNASLLAI